VSANQIVADRYARALLQLVGGDSTSLDQIDDELDMLGELLGSDPKFAAFLQNPRILPEEKKGVIRKVFGTRLSPRTLNLILLLIDKHREADLLGIAQRFSHLADLKRGVEEAEVITAVPLPEGQLRRLEAQVQRFSDHKITLRATVDPAILGGVVLRLGNRVIDGSLAYRLDQIRRSLMATTVH